MNTLKENLGDGYQQVIIGFITFLIGAIWGGRRRFRAQMFIGLL